MARPSKWNCRIRPICGAAFVSEICALNRGAHFLLPRHRRQTVVDLLHRDAAIHGTDQRTEIAADAFVVDDARNVNLHSLRVALAAVVRGSALDALMRAVFTSDVA